MRWDDLCMLPLNDITETSAVCQTELNDIDSSMLTKSADLIILSNTWQYSSNNNVEKTIRYLAKDKPLFVLSTSNFNDMTSLMYKATTKDIKNLNSFIFKNINLFNIQCVIIFHKVFFNNAR